MSSYCAHYPGSGHAKILSDAALAHVNTVGMALLGRTDTGTYPAPGRGRITRAHGIAR